MDFSDFVGFNYCLSFYHPGQNVNDYVHESLPILAAVSEEIMSILKFTVTPQDSSWLYVGYQIIRTTRTQPSLLLVRILIHYPTSVL